jgi:hypothetical protein
MASKKAQLKFNVGDRVLHKPAVLAASQSALPPRTKLGVIEEIQYKSNRRGASIPWLKIKWDSSCFSEWHMTMRIALAPNQETIDAVVQNEREKIN